jgi:hypothetical protein
MSFFCPKKIKIQGILKYLCVTLWPFGLYDILWLTTNPPRAQLILTYWLNAKTNDAAMITHSHEDHLCEEKNSLKTHSLPLMFRNFDILSHSKKKLKLLSSTPKMQTCPEFLFSRELIEI